MIGFSQVWPDSLHFRYRCYSVLLFLHFMCPRAFSSLPTKPERQNFELAPLLSLSSGDLYVS